MAPPVTYAPPHKQLGRLMIAARRRGLSFEEWWSEAVRPRKPLVMVTHPNPPAGAVRWPTDRNDRVTWQAATNEAREGWRRAYERETPTRAEEAIAFLGDAIGALAATAEELADLEVEVAAEAERDELAGLMAA